MSMIFNRKYKGDESNLLIIELDGRPETLQKLEVLKNLPPNINVLKFVDSPMSDSYSYEEDNINLDRNLFVPDFEGSLEGVIIPDQITELYIDLYLTSKLDLSIVPKSVKTLTCGRGYKGSITKDTFHEGLEALGFPEFNDNFSDDCLPSSLKELDLQNAFEKKHELKSEFFPSGLRRINTGNNFNQSLKLFSHCTQLECLSIGGSFAQAMNPGDLPNSLRYLSFTQCGNVNQFVGKQFPLVKGFLPESLEILEINQGFVGDLSGILPQSLVKLGLQNRDPSSLPKDLPTGLRVLDLTWFMILNESIVLSESNNLPKSLKVLRLNKNIKLAEGFNPSIETITYGENKSNEDNEKILNDKI